jgi:hypothetical protein
MHFMNLNSTEYLHSEISTVLKISDCLKNLPEIYKQTACLFADQRH